MIRKARIFSTASLAIAVATGAAMAQSVGLSACDTLLQRYENCLRSQMQPEEWASFKNEFDERVKDYAIFLAGDKQAQARVQAACGRHQETTKDLGGNTDCTISPFLVFQSPFLEERKGR